MEASRDDTGLVGRTSSGREARARRDQHPLLLPAGQLVRVAQEQPLGRPQPGLCHRRGDQLGLGAPLFVGLLPVVHPDPLGHRLVDGLPWVE
jgi:hypothetical protein